MAYITMAQAAKRMGDITPGSARVALLRDGIPLEEVTPRLYRVDEDVLTAYIARRGGPSAFRPGGSMGNRARFVKQEDGSYIRVPARAQVAESA